MLLKIRERCERARAEPGQGPRSPSRSVPAPDGDVTAGGNKGRGTGRAAPALRPPPRRRHRASRPPGATAPAETKRLPPRYVRAERERFGPPSAGAAAAGRRRPPGRCGPAPGRAAPRPPAAAARPRCPRPRCRPLPYLIWRRRLLIRLSPVSVACSVRLGLVEQRDVIRGGGLEAVPHLPGGSAAPPPPPPAPDPRPQPPRRSAQPAAAPPGRLMPAPALSGLAAAARPPPAPLRSRPDPRAGGAAGRASHPPWGSGLRWVRPPRGCPARFCFPVTSSLRTGLCRTGRPGSSSHPSPPGPGSSRGASPDSAPPGPAAGTALPAPDGTRRDGTDWGTQPPAGLPRPQNGGSRFAPPPSAVFVCVPGMAEPAAARAWRGGTGRDGSGDPAAPTPQRPAQPGWGACAGPGTFPRVPPRAGPQAGKAFPVLVPVATRGHGQCRHRAVNPKVEQNQQQALGFCVSKGFLCYKQVLQ